MNENFIKLKIETVVNQLLYDKHVISQSVYEEAARNINAQLYEERDEIDFI